MSLKEWVSFFLGSWEMNRSAEQTNRVNREAVLVRFVCSALRFISHEPRQKDTHSLYLQCLQQKSLLKFSERSKKFKFPSEIGNMTLFPDKTIHTCHSTSIPSAGPPSAPLTNQNTDRKTRTTRIELWPWHC